jgi:hypothetical protein
VLDHGLGDETAEIDALVALYAERRAPQGVSDVAGEILIGVSLVGHAIM